MRSMANVRAALLVPALLLAIVPGEAGAQKAMKKRPQAQGQQKPAPTKACPSDDCCERCDALGMDCGPADGGGCECCTGSADEGWWCGAPTAKLMASSGFDCRGEPSSSAGGRNRADPCGAAGTWTVSCGPEPTAFACPLAGQVPAGTLSATGVVSAELAGAGGAITLTATSGPGAGRARVVGRFDPSTCTATFRTTTPQCGDGSSTYVVRNGVVTGSRKGGSSCCSAVRKCSGKVSR